MDLSTSYLGFDLPNPFIAGSGPLADTPAHAREVEDGGAAAIVLHSLFEEHVDTADKRSVVDQYLEHIRKIKDAVNIPVFASINGHTPGHWLKVAGECEQAGADAIELNIYYETPGIDETAALLEHEACEMVKLIRSTIDIPLAVKLSPFYTSLGHFVRGLEQAGAGGIVVFNRFFEAEIDINYLKVMPHLSLSTSEELLLRLRWLSVLSASLDTAELAVSGGVHTGKDALKAVICGAHAVQMVSALLKNGTGHLTGVKAELKELMQRHNFESLRRIRASVSAARTRTDYRRVLQRFGWMWGGRP